MLRYLFRRRSLSTPAAGERVLIYLALSIWAMVVLFPIYWLVVTSFKLPIDVNTGPFYIPFVDYKPSLHAWDYIVVGDLSNDTRRNLLNTPMVFGYFFMTSLIVMSLVIRVSIAMMASRLG